MTRSFSWEKVFAFPAPLGQHDQPGPRKAVCVIGGGISGLTAAYELQRQGHEICLLEGSGRCGGRIETHRFTDSTHGELGAMWVPEVHRCVTHYVDEFGLGPLRPMVVDSDNAWIWLRGQLKRRHEWLSLAHAVGPAENSGAPSRVLQDDPFTIIDRVSRRAWDALTGGAKWRALDQVLESDDPPNSSSPPTKAEKRGQELLLAYEGSSFWHNMIGSDFGTTANPASSSKRPPFTFEEWEYLARFTMELPFEGLGFLAWLTDHMSVFESGMGEIPGGMDRLVGAFVDRLRGSIQARCTVTRVEMVQDGVLVHWLDGEQCQSSLFDYVICAMPALSVSRILFDPPLPWKTREALAGVSYLQAGKTLVHCSKRHWELVDHIFGGASYTDLPHLMCWYPSDNSDFARPSLGASSKGRAEQRAVSESPGVFVASYTWGAATERLFALSDDERTEVVMESVEKIHPWIRSDHLDVVHRIWNASGGAFAGFAPGDHRRYQASLAAPHPRALPRVFFAGEHLGVLHGWIQSAIQTGLAAATRVLEAPVRA